MTIERARREAWRSGTPYLDQRIDDVISALSALPYLEAEQMISAAADGEGIQSLVDSTTSLSGAVDLISNVLNNALPRRISGAQGSLMERFRTYEADLLVEAGVSLRVAADAVNLLPDLDDLRNVAEPVENLRAFGRIRARLNSLRELPGHLQRLTIQQLTEVRLALSDARVSTALSLIFAADGFVTHRMLGPISQLLSEAYDIVN